MLAKRFEDILHKLGMAGLEHPLFYHAPVGIRFEIGGEEPIYLDRSAAKLRTNPAYVQGALDRAAAIYRALPEVPDLLRIDGYPDEEPAESLLTVIRQRMGLPVPNGLYPALLYHRDADCFTLSEIPASVPDAGNPEVAPACGSGHDCIGWDLDSDYGVLG